MICGIDEAGRGPLAGPVCAAAVILPPDFPVDCLGDSKKLSPASRQKAKKLIIAHSPAWGIGWASAAEIDQINILQSSLLAMKRAFLSMLDVFFNSEHPALLLQPLRSLPGNVCSIEAIVDGLYVPDIPAPCRALVKADNEVPEVMAASILAKTARDRLMEIYSILYPEYGYEKHKGYPTRAHRAAIAANGPSPIQRMTFTVKPLTGRA
ncbi:MAG: ribonuclease HII [Treponema sp.]|nr:ribonuclease HII [Treponema sp.]